MFSLKGVKRISRNLWLLVKKKQTFRKMSFTLSFLFFLLLSFFFFAVNCIFLFLVALHRWEQIQQGLMLPVHCTQVRRSKVACFFFLLQEALDHHVQRPADLLLIKVETRFLSSVLLQRGELPSSTLRRLKQSFFSAAEYTSFDSGLKTEVTIVFWQTEDSHLHDKLWSNATKSHSAQHT